MVKEELKETLEEIKKRNSKIEEMVNEDFETYIEDITDYIKYSIEDFTQILEKLSLNSSNQELQEQNSFEFATKINQELNEIDKLIENISK